MKKKYKKKLGRFEVDGKECRVTCLNGVITFRMKGRRKTELEVTMKDVFESMKSGQLLML